MTRFQPDSKTISTLELLGAPKTTWSIKLSNRPFKFICKESLPITKEKIKFSTSNSFRCCKCRAWLIRCSKGFYNYPNSTHSSISLSRFNTILKRLGILCSLSQLVLIHGSRWLRIRRSLINIWWIQPSHPTLTTQTSKSTPKPCKHLLCHTQKELSSKTIKVSPNVTSSPSW